MRIDDRLGTWDDLRAAAGAQAPVLDRIRALMNDACPDGIEAVSLKQRNVWWGIGPSKMKDAFAYAAPFAQHTNLGFFHAVDLPDPEGLLQGTGARLRHARIGDPAQVDNPAIAALTDAAVVERRVARAGQPR